MSNGSVDDLYRLGFQLIESGDFAGGLEALTHADELCPNDHEIIHLMGTALMVDSRTR